MENPFFLEGKITGQIPNNFTILNRDYNTQIYILSKEKTLFFFSLTALFLTMYLSQFSLTLIYFSPLLFALTRTFFKAALSPHFHWDFSYWLFLCTNWPNSLLLFHLFLLFFLPHASHQVTINTSTQALTFVHGIRQKG